jgi:hypothetical protein
MAGSFSSRTLVLAVTAMAAATVAVADRCCRVVMECTTSFAAWLDRRLAWLVQRLPKQRQAWVPAWHRILAAPAPKLRLLLKRRPHLSTRWRFCPSV